MTTLAQRLTQLSKLPAGSHTVAQHLLAIVARFRLPLVAPFTVAAVLIAYSGLPAGLHTVAEHLAVERSAPSDGAGSPGRAKAHKRIEVHVDGRKFIVHSQAEFAALMEALRAKAEEVAEQAVDAAVKRATKRPSRKVIGDANRMMRMPEVSAPGYLQPDVDAVVAQISAAYRSAMQTIEIAALLSRRDADIERDDEEVMLLL